MPTRSSWPSPVKSAVCTLTQVTAGLQASARLVWKPVPVDCASHTWPLVARPTRSAAAALHLERPDVDPAVNDAGEAGAALVPRRRVGGVAGADGRAAGEQGHRLGRPAVVLQRAELGVDRRGSRADQVGGASAATAGAVADQVVALTVQVSIDIGPGRGAIPGDDRVPNNHHPVTKDALLRLLRNCRALMVESVTVTVPAPV